jgi:hypothetical protein
VIVKLGPHEWALYTRNGQRVLGMHKTKRDAVSQERAINIAKARAAGYRIPKKPKKRYR